MFKTCNEHIEGQYAQDKYQFELFLLVFYLSLCMAMQSPTERHEAAERDAYSRLVEEGAARECRLLEALEQGKAREEQGKAREEQLVNALQINQTQHDESRIQIQELQRLLTGQSFAFKFQSNLTTSVLLILLGGSLMHLQSGTALPIPICKHFALLMTCICINIMQARHQVAALLQWCTCVYSRVQSQVLTPAELGIIGPRVARDTGRRYALLLRDEQAFLEEMTSGVIRDPETDKEKEARLRLDAREWNLQGGPADEITNLFPVSLF